MKSSNGFIVIMFAIVLLSSNSLPAGASRSANGVVVVSEEVGGGSVQSTASGILNVGGFGQLVTDPVTVSASAQLKQGYVGQLFETQSLTTSATPSSVPETSTAQLSARATLDDGTLLMLQPWEVTWSATAGPIASINNSGVLFPSAVYQDQSATASGASLGRQATVNLIVLNTHPDNFGVYAGDGLNDTWQVQTFGTNNLAGLASADPDGDGQNNSFEYVAGTDSLKGLSKFAFRMAGAGQKAVVFNPRLPSRNYTVFFTTNLLNSNFSMLANSAISDTGTERTVTDLSATNGARFYRVEIRWP